MSYYDIKEVRKLLKIPKNNMDDEIIERLILAAENKKCQT